jgi:hypothetical protein
MMMISFTGLFFGPAVSSDMGTSSEAYLSGGFMVSLSCVRLVFHPAHHQCFMGFPGDNE